MDLRTCETDRKEQEDPIECEPVEHESIPVECESLPFEPDKCEHVNPFESENENNELIYV